MFQAVSGRLVRFVEKHPISEGGAGVVGVIAGFILIGSVYLLYAPQKRLEDASARAFVQAIIQAGSSGYIVPEDAAILPLEGLVAVIESSPKGIRPCLRDEFAPWVRMTGGVQMSTIENSFNFCTVKTVPVDEAALS